MTFWLINFIITSASDWEIPDHHDTRLWVLSPLQLAVTLRSFRRWVLHPLRLTINRIHKDAGYYYNIRSDWLSHCVLLDAEYYICLVWLSYRVLIVRSDWLSHRVLLHAGYYVCLDWLSHGVHRDAGCYICWDWRSHHVHALRLAITPRL